MALNLDGTHGELRVGTKRLAVLTGWSKQDRRVSFTVGTVNPFLAGMGAAPTEIVLQVMPKVVRVYPILAGGIADGHVVVDLMTARTETQP